MTPATSPAANTPSGSWGRRNGRDARRTRSSRGLQHSEVAGIAPPDMGTDRHRTSARRGAAGSGARSLCDALAPARLDDRVRGEHRHPGATAALDELVTSGRRSQTATTCTPPPQRLPPPAARGRTSSRSSRAGRARPRRSGPAAARHRTASRRAGRCLRTRAAARSCRSRNSRAARTGAACRPARPARARRSCRAPSRRRSADTVKRLSVGPARPSSTSTTSGPRARRRWPRSARDPAADDEHVGVAAA